MTTQLTLYNGALRVLGERELATLAENREPRRRLDGVWNSNARKSCLEQGLWKFASRAVKADADTSITPAFGYTEVFARPEDFVRTIMVCSDDQFNCPLIGYSEEAGVWYANTSPMYIKYVSMDEDYGYNLDLWPESFCRYVESYMASQICEALTQGRIKGESLKDDLKKLLVNAKSRDAFEESSKFVPPGAWSRSRTGGSRSRERGSLNSLIG